MSEYNIGSTSQKIYNIRVDDRDNVVQQGNNSVYATGGYTGGNYTGGNYTGGNYAGEGYIGGNHSDSRGSNIKNIYGDPVNNNYDANTINIGDGISGAEPVGLPPAPEPIDNDELGDLF